MAYASPIRSDSPPSAVAPARAATWIARLSLQDFRNYPELRLDLAPAPVVLTGPNGAGKTNLLEALSLLSPGRGLRRARIAEMGRRLRSADGAPVPAWAVAATVVGPGGRVSIGTGREAAEPEAGDARPRAEKRALRIDGLPQRGHAALAHQLCVLWLAPDLDRLFEGSPGARRRFLDRMVAAFDPEHAGRLAAYEHALSERSRLLAEGSDPAWLDALEDTMSRYGVAVAAARALAAGRLDRAAALGVGPFPAARVAVVGAVDAWLAAMPALDAEERLRAGLAAGRAADAAAGGAGLGPHRSDLAVRFAARDVPAQECSTGEQKALLLSLVLALARELAADRGTTPLLLLDEVVAHLDGARRAALIQELLSLGAQAWLTGTDEEPFHALRGEAQFFRVLDATVIAR